MQQRAVRFAISVLLAVVAFVSHPAPAQALPTWARKYDLACSECHSAWPTLNSFGRDFKANGYRLREEVEGDEEFVQAVVDFLKLDRGFPIAARGVMRPYDKRKDRAASIRSFHEVEVYFAGRVFDNVSAFFEIEAEDEVEFNVFVESGTMTWSPLPEANLSLGWAPVFWNDPFATLADGGHRMTRSHKGPLDQRFAARERLRSSSQWLGFFGRAADNRVFYMGGVSAGGDDPEGNDAKDGYGRAMVTAVSGVYVGGYVLAGTNQTQGVDQSFHRAGFDFQIEKRGLTVYGTLMHTKDDLVAGGDETHTLGYVEGFYIFPMRAIHSIVPLLRIDLLSDVNDRTDLTFNLNFYVVENIKTYFEWWQNIESPSGTDNDWRATWQIDFSF